MSRVKSKYDIYFLTSLSHITLNQLHELSMTHFYTHLDLSLVTHFLFLLLRRRNKKTKYSPATPEKPMGFGFLNYYPANFLKPYGLANNPPTADMFHRRTNPKSCKWLIQPDFATSEFCATVLENFDYLVNLHRVFFPHCCLQIYFADFPYLHCSIN